MTMVRRAGHLTSMILSTIIMTMLALASGEAAAAQLQSASGRAVHALIVGVDDYVYVLPKLQGSVGDAKDIAAILRDDGVVDVRMLTDLAATREAFVAEMTRLIDVSQPGDLAIITYSGHGGTVPEYPQFKGLEASGKTEEFIMVDYDTVGAGTGEIIANKEMKAWLSRLDRKGVDVLFVADSCFGGGMVRGIPDPRVGKPLLRVARDIAPKAGSSFQPIPMTQEELHTDVSTLAHVTVLTGSDRFTPVPEVFIPSPPTRRGALSYAVARALRGRAGQADSAVTTRRQLFSYARQEVQHYSDDQRIDNTPSPSANDPASLDRAVFRRASETPAPLASSLSPVAVAAASEKATCAVHLAVIHDDGGAKEGLKTIGVPFEISDNPAQSDLVWDVKAEQVIQSAGDVIANGIGPGNIAGVIQRTAAVKCIQALSETRPQAITLRGGIKRYTPKDKPTFEADGLSGRYLIVFDVTADGRLQVVWPQETRHIPLSRAAWTGSPDVIEPFGADYVVAVSSSAELRDFLDWLNSHDNSLPSVAAQVPDWLRKIQTRDTTSRIGAVSLYTGAE